MSTGKIYTIRDKKTGLVQLPVTVADAVRVGKLTLTEYLSLIDLSEPDYRQTKELGLYICDKLGNYIAIFDEEGVNIKISETMQSGIKDIASSSYIKINEQAATKIAEFCRVTDGGWLNSDIMSSVVYLGDVVTGEHILTVSTKDYFMRDFFKMHMNVPHTIKSVEFEANRLTIAVDFASDYYDVTAQVDYCVLGSDNYDAVHISLKTSKADAMPEFARVKFNKICPYSWTSDDMGLEEYTNSWCLFNGYATGRETEAYPRGVDVLKGITMGSIYPIHRPLTYTDGAGKERRYAGTAAIWPQSAGSSNYTKMDGTDAAIMARLGQSFAQHDVITLESVESIAQQYKLLSETWEGYTGIGLKVMIEPNGNKDYVRAANISDEIALAVMQNTTGEAPDIGALSTLIDDWKRGNDIMSFRRKPSKAIIRSFMSDTGENLFNMIDTADGSRILITGSHGMSTLVMDWMLTNMSIRDDIWVASIDEVWEYYHLVNHAHISNVGYSEEDQRLEFDVIIPKYAKSQFRELTVNIPTIDGSDCSIDGAVTSSYTQSEEQYVINIGVEDRIHTHITELLNLLQTIPLNSNIRQDAQYLIDLLDENNPYKDVFQKKLNDIGDARYIVSAIVRGSSGQPIVGATGRLTIGDNEHEGISIINGDLSIPNVAKGSGILTIMADGYTTQNIPVEIVDRSIAMEITLV